MPREITTHHVNGLNKNIHLYALDEPGPGGANHKYQIRLYRNGPEGRADGPLHSIVMVEFQKGAVAEANVNGVTNEVLLAIVADRIEGFQEGPGKCKDNDDALAMIKGGLTCLHKRTLARLAQGVEGTAAPHAEEPKQVDTAAL
jgi:hypothetical protein